MKKYVLFALIAFFFVSSSAWAQYVKLTANNGTVSWIPIAGTIIGTNIEIFNGGHSAIDSNTEGSIDLKEVWSESGGKGIHYKVTRIGNGAFYKCSGLTSVVIPNSVTSIGNSAFNGCSGLTSVTIPNSVTSIGSGSFDGTTWYDNQPDGVVYAGKVAYKYKGTMPANTSITLKEGTVIIASRAFYRCTGLTSISIPNSVTTIGDQAFYHCNGLTSITIPISLTLIEPEVFIGCTGLTKVIVKDIAAWCNISFGDNPLSYAHHLYSDENTEITELTIPNGVTSIKDRTFYKCSGLTSVVIPNSVTSIGYSAFYGCSGLIEVLSFIHTPFDISNGVFTNISSDAVLYVPNGTVNAYHNKGWDKFFSKVTILEHTENELIYTPMNNNNASVRAANKDITSANILSSVQILGKTYSVTNIENSAFNGCKGLTSVTIPSSVTSIGNGAFSTCSSLTSVTLPDNISSMGYFRERFPFDSNCNLYVRRGSKTLLAIWNYPIWSPKVFEIGTEKQIFKPSISFVNATQSTLTLKIDNYCEGYSYTCDGSIRHDFESDKRYSWNYEKDGGIIMNGDPFTIEGLLPYRFITSIYVRIHSDNYSTSISAECNTLPLYQTVKATKTTASSIQAIAFCAEGDAQINSTSLVFNGKEMEGDTIIITGLDPNESYTATYNVEVNAKYYKDGKWENYSWTFKESFNIKTSPLTLTTSQPKVISAGNVIVAAESNLDDEETNVGFEWRRIDWTDDFASNKGTAYLYNGTMEGYIRNLYTEKLWKYRPYYTSNAGNTYYGEWVGIDPTNTSYFEPTVHTYANVSVNGNSAEVKGYVQRGTDNVVSKGFAYWEQSQGVKSREAMAAPLMISSLPSNAKTIEVSGNQQVMTASLPNLEYETTYCYVAFVKTTEGDIFYGEEQSFITGEDPMGIGGIMVDASDSLPVTVIARYNMNGQQITSPQSGVNILRMSDGSVKKVMVK